MGGRRLHLVAMPKAEAKRPSGADVTAVSTELSPSLIIRWQRLIRVSPAAGLREAARMGLLAAFPLRRPVAGSPDSGFLDDQLIANEPRRDTDREREKRCGV
jgi:hypothetical protein